MTIEKDERVKKLKNALPKGWTRILSNKLNTSTATVSRAINEYDTESPIMDEAIKLIQESKLKRSAIEQRLDELLEE